MSGSTYYQSHMCEGYHAKVTIEWSFPEEVLSSQRTEEAENIAESILSFSGPKMRDIVQVMRGARKMSKANDQG